MQSGGILTEGEPSLDVSLIICTRNRVAKLPRALAALEAMRVAARWELIVVDNGSTDGTAESLAEFARTTVLPLVCVREARAGLSIARNAGLRVARGAVLVFTDDDCYPAPDFVDAWHACLAGGDLDFGGGRITLFDPTDEPMATKPETIAQRVAPFAYIPPGFLHGANMGFRRAVVARIGGFNVRFGAGARYFAGEDSDYFQRAANAGFAGGFVPGPLVAHHHGRKPTALGTTERDYEFARGALYAQAMLGNPGGFARHLREWCGPSSHPVALLKRIYWAQRNDPFRRIWNVTCGMASYAFDRATGRMPGDG